MTAAVVRTLLPAAAAGWGRWNNSTSRWLGTRMRPLLSLLLLSAPSCSAAAATGNEKAEPIKVAVTAGPVLHTVRDGFAGVTLDWWPPDGGCNNCGGGWRNASVTHIDLHSTRLRALGKALAPGVVSTHTHPHHSCPSVISDRLLSVFSCGSAAPSTRSSSTGCPTRTAPPARRLPLAGMPAWPTCA